MKRLGYKHFMKAATAILTSLLAIASSISVPTPARAADREFELKAAFLVSFVRYIDWPKRQRRPEELVVCVVGPDVFGNALNEVASGKTVNGYHVSIRRSVPPAEVSGCDLAYMPPAPAAKTRELLKGLEFLPVVTVGEDTAFLRMGGTIAFVSSDGKVRFCINPAAAERAGVTISSRLKVLAKNVRDEGERRR